MISADYTFDLQFGPLARRAFQLAGVHGAHESPDADEQQMAADFVDMLLKGWQAADRVLRTVERATYSLTSGTSTVPLAADTIDVEFPAYIRDTDSIDHLVHRMTLDEFMAISDKTRSGRPTRAYVERGSSISMVLDPVPDSTVTSITVARQRLVRDFESGTTPDVQQRFLWCLCLALAVQLAEHFGKSDEKIARLEARYLASKREMIEDNRERGGFRFVLGA